MTIGMQGSWTVSVKSKSASWAQRFVIQGSSNGVDGNYDDDSPPVFVTGAQWGITIEHNPTGPAGWAPSRNRLADFRVSGGQFLFDIRSDDAAGDADFNDFVLTCAVPLSDSEYVVYGTIESYKGSCGFNPCYPSLYYVIDSAHQLTKLLEYAPTRRIIEKLYPERVKPLLRRPFPEPDPAPFRPMMIPTGLTDEAGLLVRKLNTGSAKEASGKTRKSEAAKTAPAKQENQFRISAGVNRSSMQVAQSDLAILGSIKDRFRVQACEVSPISETLLQFIEYDRTEAEKLGEAYSGEGNRSILGQTATDELGQYVFRFSHGSVEQAEEVADVGSGEDLATELRPDVIIQLLESLPSAVAYETAPYFNITNIRRINLCLPEESVGRQPQACQGGQAIQAIGDIFIVPHSGTTLHSDGTISNTSTSGPKVDHAAWTGTLDLNACFLDADPKVAYYTLSYRTDSDWQPVEQEYKHLKSQLDGTWKNTRVGPDPNIALAIDGPSNPKVLVNSYLNIEENPLWLFTHRDRKAQLASALYQPHAGAVDFRIEGWDAAGNKVAGADDEVTLFIDNDKATGIIDYIAQGSTDPGPCAHFHLSSAGEPLDVRYRVIDEAGFLDHYSINVYYGSNTFEETRDAATGVAVDFDYADFEAEIPLFRFHGTYDQTLDPQGYVELELEPVDGAWLPSGTDFCAFSFELHARDRVTDGKSAPGNRILWRELVGISYSP